MLTREDILNEHRKARKRPSEEDLRRLPDRKALVYARPSSPHQVQESRESMREIGALVDLARADGYHTSIERAGIDAWVEVIRAGTAEPGVQEDGSLVVVTLDLGISGTLGQHNREVLTGILGLTDEEIESLEAEGTIATTLTDVPMPVNPPVAALIERGMFQEYDPDFMKVLGLQ